MANLLVLKIILLLAVSKWAPSKKSCAKMPCTVQKQAWLYLFLECLSSACITQCFQYAFHSSDITCDYFLYIFSRITSVDYKQNKFIIFNTVKTTAYFMDCIWETIAMKHLNIFKMLAFKSIITINHFKVSLSVILTNATNQKSIYPETKTWDAHYLQLNYM